MRFVKTFAVVAVVAAAASAAPAAVVATRLALANGVNPLALQPNTTYTLELRAQCNSASERLTDVANIVITFDPLFPATSVYNGTNLRFAPGVATADLTAYPAVILLDFTTTTPGTATFYGLADYTTNQTPTIRIRSSNLTLVTVPEPTALAIVAAGGLLGRRRRD